MQQARTPVGASLVVPGPGWVEEGVRTIIDLYLYLWNMLLVYLATTVLRVPGTST